MTSRLTVTLVSISILLCCDAGAFTQQWQVFTTEDGLASNLITAVYEDSAGRIWIGADEPGITVYENGSFEEFKLGSGDDWGDTGMICEARDYVWIISGLSGWTDYYYRGTFRLGPDRDWLMASDLYGLFDVAVAASPDGTVYRMTEDAIAYCRYDGGPATYLQWTDLADPFRALSVGPDGTLYVSSYRGTFYVFKNFELVLKESHDFSMQFREMKVDSRMGLWAVTHRLWHRPSWDSEWQLVDALDGMACSQIATGNNGTVLVRVHNIPSTFESCFMFYDGAEWARYEDNGLPRGEDGRLSCVNDMCIDHYGNWWVGTNAGLAVRWNNLPPLPMLLGVKTDASQYVPGGVMRVSLDLVGEGEARTVDLYVALETPSGELLFYPMFGTAMAPFLAGIEIPADTHIEDYELFSLTLPDVPAGTYRWYAACTHAGTMHFASNIASCEWQFE